MDLLSSYLHLAKQARQSHQNQLKMQGPKLLKDQKKAKLLADSDWAEFISVIYNFAIIQDLLIINYFNKAMNELERKR